MIESIERADDPRIASYARVGDPLWLRDHGLFVAEGRLVVCRLLDGGRFPVTSVLLTPPALASLAGVVGSAQCPIYVCDQRTLNAIGGFNFHRGCLALAGRSGEESRLDRFVTAARLFALEGVGNPDNVGGLFRVAAALGAGGVLLGPHTGDPLYRKAIRTSMGATLCLPFARITRWPADLDLLRTQGFQIVALTPDPGATPLAQYAATLRSGRRLILMLGAEGPGLTPEASSIADDRVCIPVASGVDSLNVTVAAGIALASLSPG